MIEKMKEKIEEEKEERKKETPHLIAKKFINIRRPITFEQTVRFL
jgi:hypothetical protein